MKKFDGTAERRLLGGRLRCAVDSAPNFKTIRLETDLTASDKPMATAAVTFPGTRTKARRPRHQRVAGQATLPLVFAVKPVDNSRLRREVNPEHRRECFALLGLGVAVFVFVFLVALQHFQCVRAGYEIEQFKSQRAALEEWNHQLRLEEASLADPQRIDALARQEGLTSPRPQQVIRVGPGGEAPTGSPEFARNIPNLGPASVPLGGISGQ